MEHLHALLSLQLYSASPIPPLAALQREASFLRYGGVPVSSPVDTQSHPSPSRKSLSPISPHTAGPAMSVSLRTASSSTSILPKARPSSSRRWPRRQDAAVPIEDFSTQKSGFEKKLIAEALEQYGGDIKNTASFLHIPLSTMYNKVKRYNLLPQRLKTPE